MRVEDLDRLSRVPTASWALWNTEGPSEVAFFRANIELLHGRAVVLGLNRAAGVMAHDGVPFVNFHTPGHRGDRRLERYIQGGNLMGLLGSYMTDLSLEVETDSSKVDVDAATAVEHLRDQLSFSTEPRRTIVAIGNKTFDTLCDGLGIRKAGLAKDPARANLRSTTASVHGEQWDIFRVWLHSSYGTWEHYGEVELPEQLRFINDRVGSSSAGESR